MTMISGPTLESAKEQAFAARSQLAGGLAHQVPFSSPPSSPAAGDFMKDQVRISRHDDGHLLTIVAEGPYTLSEVEASLTAAVKDVPGDRECCLLMDIRRSEAAPTQEELRKFAAFLASPLLRVAKRAAWVVSADLRYGLARQLSILAEEGGLNIRVFRDTPEAFQWS